MKVSGLPPAAPANGSEVIPIVQTVGGVDELVRMSASELAQAGTRPTPGELQAAIGAALAAGTGVTITNNVVAGTVTIAIDAAAVATATALTTGLATKQDKSPLLTLLAALDPTGNGGKTVKLNDAGDAFVFADDLVGGGVGTGINDGTYGDIVVSNAGAKMTVTIAVDKAYGVAWNNDKAPATRTSVYAKIETLAAAIAGKLSSGNVGVANGVASLDSTGKVPAGQLPSYVDDVLEFASFAAFPNPGETGKIYVALDTSKQWRWSGTAYQELTASPGTTDNVPEGPTNKYYTDGRARGATMTGLIQTVGAPAATDSLLTVLGKLWRQAFRTLTTADMPAAVPLIAADGVMEIGSFIDFHVPTVDGRDFAARIGAVSNGAGGFNIASSASALTLNGSQVALLADLNSKFDKTGGVVAGNVSAVDITAARGDGSGVIFLGSAGSHYLYWDNANYNMPNGSLVVGGNITSSSDRRLKTDIRPLEGASAIVSQLRAYRFTMNGEPGVGVIAQEVEAVLPELISTDSAGMLAVDYGKLAAVLIDDNNALRASLAALTERVAHLEAAA